MLDIKRIRQNPQELIDALKKRNSSIDVTELLQLDETRRDILGQVEALKNRRNEESKKIAQVKRAGGDAAEIMEEMRKVGDQIAEMDKQVGEIDEKINAILMRLPNFPHESVPIGKDDTENVEQRRWGEPRHFAWTPKAHWDIGTDLKILDFEAAAKISGARFTVYRGLGARLERAVINFYMDTHAADGYTEVLPPYMVTRATMTGTGQLPKFEEDAYKVFTGKQGAEIVDQDTFLIPTAEVPVTNLYRDMILPNGYNGYNSRHGIPEKGLFKQRQLSAQAHASAHSRKTHRRTKNTQNTLVPLSLFVHGHSSLYEII